MTKVIPLHIYITIQTLWRNMVGSNDYKKTQGIIREIFANIVHHDTCESLSDIETPTTIIWGEKDTYTPPHQAKIIHSLLPKSQLILLPGINHGIHLHAKEVVVEVLQKILDENQ
jgi:pimeloyl-ACP methyl ester carboxylesterase